MQTPEFIRIKTLLLSAFVLALLTVKARAVRPYTSVHPDPALEPWRWRSFPELNGRGLRCLAQARDGSIWFGTDEGARRYNGIGWTVYRPENGLYGAPVNVLCAAKDGSVYAGTDRGISRFHEGVWRTVFPPQGDLPWPINSLTEAANGGIWAGTAWGALRLSGEGATLYTSDQMGAVMRRLAPSVRLFTVPDQAAPARGWGEEVGIKVAEGAYLGAGRENIPMVIWALAPGVSGGPAGLQVGDRILAVDGQQWVTPGPSVTLGPLFGPAGTPVRLTVQREGHREPTEVSFTRKRLTGAYRDFSISDVCEDRQGRVWFGLTRGEILCYDPSAGAAPDATWRLYTGADGLDIGYGPRILQTRDGTLWTASNYAHSGVNRFDGQAWRQERLSALNGSDTNTSLLETKDGTLWIGGFALHAFRNDKWHVYHASEVPVPFHRTRLIEASDGALWAAGLGQEAARLDLGRARWTTYEGLNFQCQSPDRALWFVSQDSGVVRAIGDVWTRYGIEDGLMNWPWVVLPAPDGTIWAAGSHSGQAATARFNGKTWSFQTHPQLSWGIDPWGGVYASSDGSLWFGAMVGLQKNQLGGVLRLDSKGNWTHYPPPPKPPKLPTPLPRRPTERSGSAGERCTASTGRAPGGPSQSRRAWPRGYIPCLSHTMDTSGWAPEPTAYFSLMEKRGSGTTCARDWRTI